LAEKFLQGHSLAEVSLYNFSLVSFASLGFHNIMVGVGGGLAMGLSQKAIYSSEMFTVVCRDSGVYLQGHGNGL
jgi:hypothetical protein